MKKDGIQTRKRKPKGVSGKSRGTPKAPPPTTTPSSSTGTFVFTDFLRQYDFFFKFEKHQVLVPRSKL